MQIVIDLPETVVAKLASLASETHSTFDLLMNKLAKKGSSNPDLFLNETIRPVKEDSPYTGNSVNDVAFANFRKQAQSFNEIQETESLLEEYDEMPDYTPFESDSGEFIL